jgi:hypothetical protein
MHRTFPCFIAAALVVVGLSGCSHYVKPCPASAALAAAASLTDFPEGTAPDPSHALYTAQITDVTTNCDLDLKAHSVESSLEITFRVSRAPTGVPLHGTIPYFVLVNGEGGILTRQNFKVEFQLDPGQATTTFKDNVASIVIDQAKEKQPWDYQLLVGLQLTKAQLDYNRTVGRYTP